MRYFKKRAIVSVAASAAVFVTAYSVEDAELRNFGRQQREAMTRGELWTCCGPRPIHYAIAYGFMSLVTVPLVLLSARGVWRLCTRPHPK
jgi:hypothetical protein